MPRDEEARAIIRADRETMEDVAREIAAKALDRLGGRENILERIMPNISPIAASMNAASAAMARAPIVFPTSTIRARHYNKGSFAAMYGMGAEDYERASSVTMRIEKVVVHNDVAPPITTVAHPEHKEAEARTRAPALEID